MQCVMSSILMNERTMVCEVAHTDIYSELMYVLSPLPCSEGFPVSQGGTFSKTYELVPLLNENRVRAKSYCIVPESTLY